MKESRVYKTGTATALEDVQRTTDCQPYISAKAPFQASRLQKKWLTAASISLLKTASHPEIPAFRQRQDAWIDPPMENASKRRNYQ